MFAFAGGREIGVDLECVRSFSDLSGLAESCFTTAENAALAAIPEDERLRAFFAGWTRKEAFLKATGKGLSLPLQAFSVSLAPGSGWRELTIHGERGVGPDWTLVSVAPPRPEFSAALVVEGREGCLTTSKWPVVGIPSSNAHSMDGTNKRRGAWLVPKFGGSELD
jgi:4'-phosphopantetheinyl transferase